MAQGVKGEAPHTKEGASQDTWELTEPWCHTLSGHHTRERP